MKSDPALNWGSSKAARRARVESSLLARPLPPLLLPLLLLALLLFSLQTQAEFIINSPLELKGTLCKTAQINLWPNPTSSLAGSSRCSSISPASSFLI